MNQRTNITGTLLIILMVSIALPSSAQKKSTALRVPSKYYSEPKYYQEILSESRKDYTIQMDGMLDFDNSSTRTHNDWIVSFQPNLSLTIENIGDVLVENPRIVINDRGNWYTLDDLLTEILKDANNEQEKLYAIWFFLTRRLPHDNKIFRNETHEVHDPVKMFNIYGKGLCGDLARVHTCLWYHAGFNEKGTGKTPLLYNVHGHTSNQVFYEGQYQILDIDFWTFYLDMENEKPLPGEAMVRDHYLARREHSHGPEFRGWNSVPATHFGEDDGTEVPAFISGHEIRWSLRPGEKVVHRWDNIGKAVSDLPEEQPRSRWRSSFYGNSQIVYIPRLYSGQWELGAEESHDIVPAAAKNGSLSGGSSEAYLIYQVKSPYVICGGRIRAGFQVRGEKDRIRVSVSLDRRRWQEIWNSVDYLWMQGPSSRMSLDQAIDDWLEPFGALPKYAYWVRIDLSSSTGPGGAALDSLILMTDIVNFPLSLPSLRLGVNTVRYTDETVGPHSVRVTHSWQECDGIVPPQPPLPVYPPDKNRVRDSIVKFRWTGVKGCSSYHIRVSRYPDMRFVYRPCFDTILEDTTFFNPYTGIFSDGKTYYWQVRCREEHGVWSAWCEVNSFSWHGPHVPVDVNLKKKGEQFELSWGANRRGTRPAYYEVYGSDEKGFSVSKEPYEVWKLGKCPSNYLGRTKKRSMVVVSPDGKELNMNRAYYRVVAVDGRGTSSGCSDYAEMPRPYVYTRPVREAKVGEEYHYTMQTISSIGDLQKRKPNQSFKEIYRYWEKEAYRYTLLEGPSWLELNRDNGVLSGTPSIEDTGKENVRIRVDTYYPHELAPWIKGGAHHFSKCDQRFQRIAFQTFTLSVKD